MTVPRHARRDDSGVVNARRCAASPALSSWDSPPLAVAAVSWTFVLFEDPRSFVRRWGRPVLLSMKSESEYPRAFPPLLCLLSLQGRGGLSSAIHVGLPHHSLPLPWREREQGRGGFPGLPTNRHPHREPAPTGVRKWERPSDKSH